MVTVKSLDEIRPEDLWREVRAEPGEFWNDAREKQQRLLKTLLEGALEEEMTVLLQAGRYRHTEARTGYRNGFYSRDLVTQIGIVSAIRVPRARSGRLKHSVFSCERIIYAVVSHLNGAWKGHPLPAFTH